MAGTVVRDATGPNLATGATLDADGTTSGDVVDLQYPCEFAVELVAPDPGATGTLGVTIQAADNADFDEGVVDLGSFAPIAANVAATGTLKCYTNKRYVAASVVVGTSGDYTGLTLKVVPFYDRHTTELSA